MLTWWPEHPTKSFFPGKAAAAVLGVRNVGSEPLNVTYAMANLASPYNASMNLFNFTGQVRARGCGLPHATAKRAVGSGGGSRPQLPRLGAAAVVIDAGMLLWSI